MKELFSNGGMSLGFSMALMRNKRAFERFGVMNPEDQQRLIEGAKNMESRKEMQEYVDKIAGDK